MKNAIGADVTDRIRDYDTVQPVYTAIEKMETRSDYLDYSDQFSLYVYRKIQSQIADKLTMKQYNRLIWLSNSDSETVYWEQVKKVSKSDKIWALADRAERQFKRYELWNQLVNKSFGYKGDKNKLKKGVQL
jgi:hypothetical protein